MESRSNMRRHAWILATVFACIGWSTTVLAEGNDDTSRAMARSLGVEGLAAMDVGDMATALDRFNRAYQIHPVPTLALWTGRVLEKLGKLVAASERYREASRMDVSGGDEEPQRQAQQVAVTARERLVSRIPSLKIEVLGGLVQGDRLTLDGAELPGAVIGSSLPIDPGDHAVALQRSTKVAKRQFHLGEGSRETVVLAFGTQVGESTLMRTTEGLGRGQLGTPNPPSSPASAGGVQKTMGWVATGIGVVGLVTWGVTGLMAVKQNTKLEKDCVDNQCDVRLQSDLDRFRLYRTLSSVGFVTGLVGVGAGAVLVLSAPHRVESPKPTAQWHAWVGLNGVGVEGQY